jgi:glycerol kinase
MITTPAQASENVLAIDQGTSGTKAIVLSPDRGVIGLAEVAVTARYDADGLVEQDPAELLASVLDSAAAALREAGEPVGAVGLANQGETVLAWDRETGAALTPAVVWQDRRSTELCRELAPAAAELHALSGLPLDPYFAAPKMAWLRQNMTRDGVVTTSDSWLVHQLTGRFVTDVTTASRTMLLDLETLQWSARAATVFGLADEPLPELVSCDQPVGETSAFGGSLPVTGLVVDQQAALLAEGCLTAGTAKCTYGTGAFLLVNTGETPVRSSHGLPASVAWRLGGEATYCLDGQVYTVASVLAWLVTMGVLDRPDSLDDCARTVTDAGDVEFLPAFSGLGAPWWHSQVRGSIHGLGLDAVPGHLARAFIEGVAAQVVATAQAVSLDTGVPLLRLRVDGGLTQSQVLMQTQADLLQAPVEVYASPHATALGAAAMARIGAGLARSAADALAPLAPAAVYEPAISAQLAADRLGRFDALVRRSAPR